MLSVMWEAKGETSQLKPIVLCPVTVEDPQEPPQLPSRVHSLYVPYFTAGGSQTPCSKPFT